MSESKPSKLISNDLLGQYRISTLSIMILPSLPLSQFILADFMLPSHLFHPSLALLTEASEAWMDSDRDYSYDELLQRVFGIMRDRNPDMVAGEKRKFVMRPPQVVKVGTKKTAFVNFTEIAKM